MRSRTQMQRFSGFNIIKWNKWTTKTTPKGKNKQAGRRLEHSQTFNSHETHERQRISTGLQTQGDYIGRQTRVTRETQLEPLKQWLSNKMGGDRQSTWEHMAPTNNKPCALHTETSGGQPGHTSRTVTKISSMTVFNIDIKKSSKISILEWFWKIMWHWSLEEWPVRFTSQEYIKCQCI